MLTATGRHITDNITELGRFVASNLTEFGEYAPTAPAFMSGGFIFGGISQYQTAAGFTISGGAIFDGASLFETGYSLTTSSGAVVSGLLNIGTGYNLDSSIGMVSDGQMLPFIIGSLGMVVGGNNIYNWSSAWSWSEGAIVGGSSIKKQFPLAQTAPIQPTVTLIDNSITFKLEEAP